MPVSASGIEQTNRQLHEMQIRAANLIPVWRRVGAIVAAGEKRQYATEGAYLNSGHVWAPLSPAYAAWKQRTGHDGGIEVLSGDTRKGLTSRPMDIEEYYPQHAVFGVSGKIAYWQQHGTRFMPKRTLIAFTKSTRNSANRAIARYVTNGSVTP
jgi:hypothetical protein